MAADLAALRADEQAIQRIATARASKAVRLVFWMVRCMDGCVTTSTVPGLSIRQRDEICRQAGVKVASPMTWDVVQRTIEQIVEGASRD